MRLHLSSGVFFALFVLSAARPTVAGQLVLSMTPESTAEAIQLAADEEAASRFLELYVLQSRAGWGNGPRIGIFSTPFSRVVQAAVAARKQGKSVSAADISPDLIIPELHVIATSQKAASDDTDVNVYSVALASRGSKEAAEALQPLRAMELTAEYQNLHGTAFAGAGVVAVFPLTGLPANCEVRVIIRANRSRFVRCGEVPRVHRLIESRAGAIVGRIDAPTGGGRHARERVEGTFVHGDDLRTELVQLVSFAPARSTSSNFSALNPLAAFDIPISFWQA